jgi:Alpha/beta hydrolase of unknown function (DUF1400)
MNHCHSARAALVGLASLLLLVTAAPVRAAETVVLRYGIFRGSVPVADLTEFAETGETSRQLRRYLRLADQEPEEFRQILTETVATDARNFDRLITSPAGDALLNELSDYLYSPRQDDQEALKTALTTSAEDDNQISLLEVLQNYPTEAVHVNVRRAIATYERFAAVQQRVDRVLDSGVGDLLQDLNILPSGSQN